MRYEDASNSFQGSGPNANDDSDQLPAGAKEAATGNLITGEGTQYGAAGADSAAGGHITSIAGKGGEDSSFAGGKLSVAGEYGKLSVDAEGNYNYMANKGAPENVRDRFTYTLADNQGGSDTAALVIELGKTPVVIKADAQQVVPGPDGVVTLPPGVELSDVMVVGRNLVINMPDGTQLIIVDGAVFVPQLVVDGVSVPATNVAALLIGQEPQPAAGELPPSSGGNFALPPPPLDPGVPLGDLIPPTVRDYVPPEPQETFPIEDRPLINFGNIDILIDDDTLPGGLAGGPGDGPDAVNVTGFLSAISDLGGDPPYTFSLSLTTAPEGFELVSGGPGVALLQQNGVTVRTIAFNEATGQYEVTQNAPILHPDGSEENNLIFVLTVTVTDSDGDTASGTITITYNDDTPEATDAQVGGIVDEDGVPGGIPGGPGDVAGENTVVNGSVAGLFEAGADGPLTYGLSGNTSGLPSLTSNGVPVTYAVVGNTLTASAGGTPVFTLTVQADGSYTFTLLDQLDHPTLNGQTGDNSENDMSLALGSIIQATDSDGDAVTAPANGLVIVVNDDTPLNGEGRVLATVDEDELPDGNTDGDGETTVATGSLSALAGDIGADQPGTFGWDSTALGSLPTLTSNGQAIHYAIVGNTLVAYTGADANTVANQIFTVELQSNGDYEINLLGQVDHLPNEPANNDDQQLTIDLSPVVVVQDADGDAVHLGQGQFTLDIEDDIPAPVEEVSPVTGLVDEDDLPTGNDDAAAGDDDPGNADGDNDGTTTGGGAGSLLSLFDIGADQPGKIVLLSDTSGLPVLHSNGVLVTYEVNGNVLTASAGADTVFTLTVNEDGSWVFNLEGQLDHPTAGTEDNLDLDLSSVIGAEDADGDTSAPLPDGSFVVTVDDDLPVADGEALVGGLVDEDDLPTGNDDTAAGDDNPGNADGDNDGTTTGGSAGSLAALFNVGADAPLKNFGLSTDTSGLPVLHSNGVLVTYEVVGDTLTASAGADTVFTLTVNADGSWSFDLEGQLDHPTAGTEDNLLLDLSSIITAEDADGDPATAADGTFVIVVDDDLPVANDEAFVGGLVDEDNLPSGNNDVAAGDDNPGNADGDNDGTTTGGNAGSLQTLFNIGADQPGKIVLLGDTSGLPVLHSNGVLVTYAVVGDTLTASAGGDTVFTLTVNEDGSWSFDLEGQLDHPTAGTEDNLNLDFSSIIGVEDADGDPASAADGTFVITVDDDLPVADGEARVGGLVDEDNLPTGNNDVAAGDDNPGNADGDNDGTTTGGNAGSLAALFNAGADQPLQNFGLSTDTSGLPVLHSNGVLVTYSVVGDTLTASAGGTTVFTLTVNANGSWEFDLEGQLDHPVADTEDNLELDLSSIITAEDADGDPATAADGTFVIVVDDDLPVAANDLDTVGAPGSTATGNVITDAAPSDGADGDNGADRVGADRPGTITDVVSNNEPGNTDQDADPDVFEIQGEFGLLVMNADGSYTYTRDANTPGGEQDVFTYTLTDADGDSVEATLTITLADDRPIATTAAAAVDDEGLANGILGGAGDLNANAGDLNAGQPGDTEAIFKGVLGGSAGDGTTTFFFPADLDGDIVVIGQENVTLDVSADGLTITGTGPRGPLFTVQITDAETGDYTVTLLDNVLHTTGALTENDATLVLNYQMEDADGDLSALPGQLTITFDDDIPTVTTAQVTGDVDEDDVPGGLNGGPADATLPDPENVDTGSVTSLFNSGADTPLTYSLLDNTSGLPNLTSGGVALVYDISGNTLTATAGNGGPVVFTFVLQSNGNWTFTLSDQLDHPNQNGTPDDNSENNLAINLSSIIQASDADGDTVGAPANGLIINVDDDTPANNGTTLTPPTVHEDVLNNADAIGNPEGGGQTVNATITVASLLTLVDAGADAPITIGLNALIEGNSTGLTQNGVAIVWDYVSPTQVQGVVQGTTDVVFTLTYDAGNQEYDFVLLDNIDHDTDADLTTGEGDSALENLDLANVFTATDFDSDTIVINGGASINIQNDVPVNFTPVALTDDGTTPSPLDDALVNDGTASAVGFLNDTNGNPTNGENFIGADGFGSLEFINGTDGDQLLDGGGTPRTSGGDAIYLFGYGTDVLTATTSADNSDPSAVVFTVTLTEGAGYGSASTYEIEFSQAIDDGSGFVFDDFSTAPAGQNDWVGLDADGLDINDPTDPTPNSEDLLLTPTNVGGSVNTSATDIGNANQWIDTGEGTRIDYVVDIRRDGANDEKDLQGYAFDSHYMVDDSSFQIMQTQGGGLAAVRITAFLDNDSGTIKTLDGGIVAIDPSSIVITNGGVAATGYTITALPDGSVVITGLEAGDNIAFETVGDADFSAYSVQNANTMQNTATPAPGDTFSGAAFAIGVFGFSSASQGDPFDLSFDVQATDADGDTSTGTIDVSMVPEDIGSLSTFASTSLMAEEEQLQKTAANSNTLTLATAVAAAGYVEPVAAHDSGNHGGHGQNSDMASFAAVETVERYSVSDDSGDAAVSMLAPDSSSDASAPADTSSSSSSDNSSSSNSLDDSSAQAAPESNDAPAADDSGSQGSADAVGPVAPTVAMVSAEALQAAAEHGNAQKGGSVEQIVAEALHQGGSDVDAVLANLPGGNGALQAIAHMASPDAAAVSGWHTAGFGAFGTGHDVMLKMDVSANHHDAVQPVANG